MSNANIPFLTDLSLAARERLLILAERLSRALRSAGYGHQGINLLINDGPAANQHVAHLHLHLIPRREGDLPKLLWRAVTRFLPLGARRSRHAWPMKPMCCARPCSENL